MESIRQSKADYPPKRDDGVSNQEDSIKRREINFIFAGLERAYMNKTGKDFLSQTEIDGLMAQAVTRQKMLDQNRPNEKTGDATREQQEIAMAHQNRRIRETYGRSVIGEATIERAIGIGDNPNDTAEAIRLANIDAENATLREDETADDVAQQFMEKSGLVAPAQHVKKPKPTEKIGLVEKLKRRVFGE